jgi:hypothetical protein
MDNRSGRGPSTRATIRPPCARLVPASVISAAEAMTVRMVNYTLLPSGYFDPHGDPSFRSRVLVLHLDRELRITASVEAVAPDDLPTLSLETLGFEDPRPFVWRDGLWCASSVRQLNPEAAIAAG